MILPLLTYTYPERSEGKVAMLLGAYKPILTVSALPSTSLETELWKGSHARRKKNYFLAAFDSIVWLLSSQFSFLLFDWSIDISVCNRSITGWERGVEDKAQSHGGRRSPLENKTFTPNNFKGRTLAITAMSQTFKVWQHASKIWPFLYNDC